jgi:hypothetical protein
VTVQLITEEQALFLATLPDVFCDLQYAIRVHASTNRVAEINEDAACDAIEYGLGAKVVETDGEGKLRLVDQLKREREKLEASEGYFELAVFEVSRAILKQAEQAVEGDSFPPSGMTAPEQ